jgi:hypothetical protein
MIFLRVRSRFSGRDVVLARVFVFGVYTSINCTIDDVLDRKNLGSFRRLEHMKIRIEFDIAAI